MPSNFSNKLCNPTPFDSSKRWERGIDITIPAFSTVDLSINQVNDFRDGQPGSEAVRDELDSKGWFLLDPDRTYEVQALAAVRRCIDKLQHQMSEAKNRLIEGMAALGQKEPEVVEERMRLLGYGIQGPRGTGLGVSGKLEQLKKLEKKYAQVVSEQVSQTTEKTFDPTRTLYVDPGPREFPSAASLEFFLDQHPDIKARHLTFMKEFHKAQKESLKPKKVEEVQLDAQ